MSVTQNGGTAVPANGPARVVGVDIGGTKISAVLLDERGEIIGRDAQAAPARDGGDAMADAAADLVTGLVGDARLITVGVGAAGVIDHITGVVRAASSTFVGWAGYPLADALTARLGVPVRVENDVNAFLLGEVSADGFSADDVLGVMLGTGVGGAVLLDGRLRHGPNGAAGEIGHTPGFSELQCTCGQRGHLETLASGTSIGLRYAERTGTAGLDARAVADRARLGDADAVRVYADAGRALALACATAAGVLDIGHVVVGGGVASSWDLLQPAIEQTLAVDSPISGVPLRIMPSRLGGDAVAVGAAAAARRSLVADAAPAPHAHEGGLA